MMRADRVVCGPRGAAARRLGGAGRCSAAARQRLGVAAARHGAARSGASARRPRSSVRQLGAARRGMRSDVRLIHLHLSTQLECQGLCLCARLCCCLRGSVAPQLRGSAAPRLRGFAAPRRCRKREVACRMSRAAGRSARRAVPRNPNSRSRFRLWRRCRHERREVVPWSARFGRDRALSFCSLSLWGALGRPPGWGL